MNPIATIAAAQPQEEESKPSASEVARLKASLPGRDIHRVEMIADDDTSFVFVMTGPTRAEWKKYQDEISLATGDRDKQQKAIETAALAQIRWPSRDDVRMIFENNPGLIVNFPEQLNKLARLEVRVTSKKL